MMTFDIMKIKDELESLYDAEFTVKDELLREGKELVYQKKNNKLLIYVSRYTCSGEQFGKESVGYDFWNGESGQGGPCDSVEELIHRLDSIKLPRRLFPRSEQLSLF